MRSTLWSCHHPIITGGPVRPWDRSRVAGAGPQDSEHSSCGYDTRDDALWSSSSHRARAGQGMKSNESFERMFRNKPTALGKGGCWTQGRWLRSGDAFLKEHGAGLQLCCRTLKGDVTAPQPLPGVSKCTVCCCMAPSPRVTAVTCGCHFQWQWDHWLLTVSLTPEMPALSFSVRFV